MKCSRIILKIAVLFQILFCAHFNFINAQVTFTAVGDILFDRGVKKTIDSNSVYYLFDGVKNIISKSDLAFFNLECPLANLSDGFPLKKKNSFRADTSNIIGLKYAGFNIASVANNHTMDYGKNAFMKTINLLKSSNIFPVGGGVNQVEAFKPILLEKNGETFAFFAMVEFILDATVYDSNSPYPAFGAIDTLCAKIRELNSKIDHIIVSFHWGKENTVIPSPHQIELAHKVIDAGADLVLGHHPHVLQSIEKYHDKLIIYSLGNFVFDNQLELNKQSLIFKCKFDKGKINEPELIPIEIVNNRPIVADSVFGLKIFNHLENVSDGFNVKINYTRHSIHIDYTVEKTVKEIFTSDFNFNVYNSHIQVYDNFGYSYNYNLPDSDFIIKDICAQTEDRVIYLYAIVYNQKTEKSRIAIFPFSLDKLMFLQASLDKHDHFNPWKIDLFDIDGDQNPELIVGVNKSTRYDEKTDNRLFVFNREKAYIFPKWLGSKLAFPFIDFKIDYSKGDLILLEAPNALGISHIALYKWNGFGFDRDKVLGEIQSEADKKQKFQLSDLKFNSSIDSDN